MKLSFMFWQICNFGHCKLQFWSITLHMRVAIESQYLIVAGTMPFSANQNVKYDCFHCPFQIFHIFLLEVYSTASIIPRISPEWLISARRLWKATKTTDDINMPLHICINICVWYACVSLCVALSLSPSLSLSLSLSLPEYVKGRTHSFTVLNNLFSHNCMGSRPTERRKKNGLNNDLFLRCDGRMHYPFSHIWYWIPIACAAWI